MENKNRKRAAGVAGLIATAAVVGGVIGTSQAAQAATTTPAPAASVAGQPPADMFSKAPVRSDEKALGATEAAKVTAAAQAAVDGATVFRVETDGDGSAYEAHMKKSDGSVVTVKLDAGFKVTSTEDGFGAGGPQGGPRGGAGDNDGDGPAGAPTAAPSTGSNG